MRGCPVGCISTCAAGALAVSTAPVVHYLKDAVAAWRTPEWSCKSVKRRRQTLKTPVNASNKLDLDTNRIIGRCVCSSVIS